MAMEEDHGAVLPSADVDAALVTESTAASRLLPAGSAAPSAADVEVLPWTIALRDLAIQVDARNSSSSSSASCWLRSQRARHLVLAWIAVHGAPPSCSPEEASDSWMGQPIAPEVARLLFGSNSHSSSGSNGASAVSFSYNWADVAAALTAQVTAEKVADCTTKAPIVEIDAESLAAYYTRCLLPLLEALALPQDLTRLYSSGDSIGSGGATAFAASCVGGAVELPDPARGLSRHNAVARRVALHCLRRQQLCLAARFVLAQRPQQLVGYLRSTRGRCMVPPHAFPAWWCPWVHDLTLVVSAAQHGVLRHQILRAEDGDNDSTGAASGQGGGGGSSRTGGTLQLLPTAPSRVTALVKRTFLQPPQPAPTSTPSTNSAGSGFVGGVAAAAGVFTDAAAAEQWAQRLAASWPSASALEARLEAACVALTVDLPRGHPLKIRPCPFSPLATDIAPAPSSSVAATPGSGGAVAKNESVGGSEAGWPLALPALLAESAARRSAYLERRINLSTTNTTASSGHAWGPASSPGPRAV